MTHARLTPFLLIRCESCDDEHNCHPAKRVRWSVPMQGYDAGPIPVCQACWDGQYPDIPCHWQELNKITLSPEFGFTADERAVIDELAITQTTSPIAVLRQSLRLYQMHLKRLRDGETIHYSGTPSAPGTSQARPIKARFRGGSPGASPTSKSNKRPGYTPITATIPTPTISISWDSSR